MKPKKPTNIKGLTEVVISRSYFIEVEEGMDNEDIYMKAIDEFNIDFVDLEPNRSDFVCDIRTLKE